MKRVLLLSTVHPAADSRIVYKIAPVLCRHYEVICALPHLQQPAENSWRPISLPRFERLLPRILFSHPITLLKCIRLRPHIVHIFVPELIPLALLFRMLGAEVIYEVQENLFKKFAIKRYNKGLVFQTLFAFFDRLARRQFHCIFTDDAYLQEYRVLRHPWAVIHNYVSLPVIDAFAKAHVPAARPAFFYLGVVSMERCLDTMIGAMARLVESCPDCHLHCYGPLRVSEHELENIPGYSQVKQNITFHGYTDQRIALRHARQAVAGIALLRPVADYPESFPTKLFEYMALRLPVITSDFPAYRQIVERSECGFCITPDDPQALCEAMTQCLQDAARRERMGRNSRAAAEAHYNWQSEAEQMLNFYHKI